jgi:hypothetical protein
MTNSPNPNPILPPDPEYMPIHTRNYEVRAFKVDDSQILLRGAVRDDKPAGLYVLDDVEPLTIHHMVVELRITFPMMEIIDANVQFNDFPHDECPGIAATYKQLIGLSIARGFNQKVRELFGGSRGCTHTSALLQAMGPVAIQCGWSMRVVSTVEGGPKPSREMTPDMREMAFRSNINTCHIWDEDGDQVRRLRAGEDIGAPLSVTKRLTKLGRDQSEWNRIRD